MQRSTVETYQLWIDAWNGKDVVPSDIFHTNVVVKQSPHERHGIQAVKEMIEQWKDIIVTESKWNHGKLCYLILPSKNAQASAKFYTEVFHWTTRRHDNGNLAFDDTTGMVSGMWDTNLIPRTGGYEIDIWVDDVPSTAERIEAAGGSLVGGLILISEHEQYRRFIDPDGNQLGIYHHRE